MKTLLLSLCLTLGLALNAQEIKKDGKVYEVKNDKIFLNGEDVTETLAAEEKTIIFAEAKKIKQAEQLAKAKEKEVKKQEKAVKQVEKAEKKAEKAQKKAEKAHKRAEKEAKKTERELKKKAKAQKNFNKASKDLDKAQQKYQKLKNKGKLSPVDEQKWLDKIEKLNKRVGKAKSKM